MEARITDYVWEFSKLLIEGRHQHNARQALYFVKEANLVQQRIIAPLSVSSSY